MVKGGIGGGNTQTGIIFEGRIDIISYINDSVDGYECKLNANSKGRATDNICIERFWRSAKVEKLYLNEYFKISTLKNDVSDYMQFYNYRRFHETLNYKKPIVKFFCIF